MTTYRTAKATDLAEVLDMGMALLAIAYGEDCRPNRAAMKKVFEHVYVDPRSEIFIAERDGLIVGVLGLWVYEHPMTAETMGTEVMWWSDPAARGVGVRLFHMAKRFARTQGVQTLHFMSPSEETDVIYSRLGLKPIERTFQMRLT